MPESNNVVVILGSMVIALPALLLAWLGLFSLWGKPHSEPVISRSIYVTTSLGLLAAAVILLYMLTFQTHHVVIEWGNWVHIEHLEPQPDYHFAIKFVFDRLSVPIAILVFLLCGVIGAFSSRYMHREPGYNRFFVNYAIFMMGMVTASLAGTIETLFLGWEMVGLSSALLVGFFHQRPAPVRNAFRVWIIYRISDAALLIAAIVLHHLSGEGDLDRLTGYHDMVDASSWPFGVCPLSASQIWIVGSLLLVAAAGKSALVPFSGWLPRAMEGPTPSSAIFYGSLSVHLGVFLLLRTSPLLDASPLLSGMVVALGLITALFAAITGRVQTDIKSALSYACLTQVGLIVVEIGLGFRYLPLVHLLGHACLRTLQFLRASSVIRDHHGIENALGNRLPRQHRFAGKWLYRFALERCYLDALLERYLAGPFTRFFRWCNAKELAILNSTSTTAATLAESMPDNQPLQSGAVR